MNWETIAAMRLFGPVLLSAALCGIMFRLRIEDAPDGGRKTQAAPVPNSGGVAILLTLAVSAWLAGLSNLMSGFWIGNGTGLILAVALSAGIIGLVDDKWGMRASLKLGLVIAVAAGFALLAPRLDIPGLPPFVVAAGIALWLVITMNAVNFMDGSNGLAMGSTAIMLFGAAMILWRVPYGQDRLFLEPDLAFLCLTAVPAILGFLAWNLPGRLFAGDSGSLGVGAFYGAVSIAVAQVTTIWTAAILFMPFLLDVMLTIFWRARNGQSVMQAHREHAYQLFLRSGWKHLPVAVLWWVFSWACALVALNTPDELAMTAFFGLAIVGGALWFIQRLMLGRKLRAEGR